MNKAVTFVIPGILITLMLLVGAGLLIYEHQKSPTVVYVEKDASQQEEVKTQGAKYSLEGSEKIESDEENTGTGKNSDASALEQLIDEINKETKNNNDIVDP